jgi:hypothetical protein
VSKREQVGGVGTTRARREAPIRQASENSFTKTKRHAANPRRHHTPSSSVAVDSRIAVRGGFLYVAQRDAGVECGGDAGHPAGHRGRDPRFHRLRLEPSTTSRHAPALRRGKLGGHLDRLDRRRAVGDQRPGFSGSTRTAAVPARARTRHHQWLAPRRFLGAAARPLVAATLRW